MTGPKPRRDRRPTAFDPERKWDLVEEAAAVWAARHILADQRRANATPADRAAIAAFATRCRIIGHTQ